MSDPVGTCTNLIKNRREKKQSFCITFQTCIRCIEGKKFLDSWNGNTLWDKKKMRIEHSLWNGGSGN